MEAARERHDSLADQLLELKSIQDARIAAEEEAKRQALEEARRRQEAEAQRRREEEAEAQRRAEEEAAAQARAQQEAEQQLALQRLEANLRETLEQEAEARATKLRHELEANLAEQTAAATTKAKGRARPLIIGAIAIALTAVATYALALRPTLEHQRLEIHRLTQELQVLQNATDRLQRERDDLRQQLNTPPTPTPTHPPALREQPNPPTKQRRPLKPTPDRQAIPGLNLNNDDPLEGL